MNLDKIDFSKLPEAREEAFTEFVQILNEEYGQKSHNDRSYLNDNEGNYTGTYEPERSYVTAVLAFLDEYDMEADVVDISDVEDNDEFYKHFGRFKSKVQYITTRYRLRQNRISSGSIGTVVTLGSTYKSEIGRLLEKIRKIVNQEVQDGNKKDKIFAKIAGLQSEVDRDRTTIDVLFGRTIDLSRAIGESAENLSPAVDIMERIKRIFWDGTNKVDQLPKQKRPKLITKKDANGHGEDDDEIPF